MVCYKNPRTHLPWLVNTYEEYSGSHLPFQITRKSNDTSSGPLEHMPNPKTSYEVLGKMSRWIKSSHLGFRITPKSNKTSRGFRNPLGTFFAKSADFTCSSYREAQNSHWISNHFKKTQHIFGTPRGMIVKANLKVENVKSLRLTHFLIRKTPPLNFKTPPRICQKWQ